MDMVTTNRNDTRQTFTGVSIFTSIIAGYAYVYTYTAFINFISFRLVICNEMTNEGIYMSK